MLQRSISKLSIEASTAVSQPARKLLSNSSQLVSSLRSYTQALTQTQTNTNNSYKNNTYNKGSRSSFGGKVGALLAFPAFMLAAASAEFDVSTDDKENECIRLTQSSSLKRSANSLQALRSSGFITPLELHDTRLCIGASIVPHPAKRAKGGEDAYFISDDMKTIGIADGVGGWGDIGVDPAMYSRMLMASGKFSADSIPLSQRDPVRIMSEAYEHSMDIQGSATCCVVVLDGYCLKTANLGDSGFMVVRGTDIVFRSKEQQHSFNFPYQLGTGSADMPFHAVNITVNILPGDLIIVGTDGLWDNLYDDEIVETTTQATDPMTIAQLIARQAHLSASSKTIISPFAKAARENGYPLATGGKMDDISVIVARVVLSSDGNLTTSFAA